MGEVNHVYTNLDPYSFTGTAVILGYLLTNDFTTSEQAALEHGLML